MTDELFVDYDVASEFHGHKAERKVPLVEAAKNIFNLVKEKGMQVAVKGTFISFNTIDELSDKLADAVKDSLSIRVYDEDLGG